jgi:uncharacterized membrane protein HdeD (DUF308 family)
MLDRHTYLASRRSNSALLVVLIDLLTTALSIGLYGLAINRGMIGFVFLLILLVLLFLIWGCLLVAVIFALKAVIWHRSVAGEGRVAELFFESGNSPPNAAGLTQDQAQYSQQFRQTRQDDLVSGAVNVLWSYSMARNLQEQRIHRAILWTGIALLVFGLAAFVALVSMI